jgi:hypothetical protein
MILMTLMFLTAELFSIVMGPRKDLLEYFIQMDFQLENFRLFPLCLPPSAIVQGFRTSDFLAFLIDRRIL